MTENMDTTSLVPHLTRVIKREDGVVKDVLLSLPASKFTVDVPPTPWFGQDVEKDGFAPAYETMINQPTPEPHDFGVCTIVPDSLRELPTGEWAIKLSVPKPNRRYPDAPFVREVLDDDGNVVGSELVVKPAAESWILVLLDMVTPLPDHDRSRPYYQRDSEYLKDERVNAKSAKVEAGRQPSDRKRAKSKRVSPARLRAMLAAKAAEAKAKAEANQSE